MTVTDTTVPEMGAPAATLRVLAVDDNAAILKFLAAAFSAYGCVIAQASTAEQAIERISAETFDLVVSDIKMPGLSGLDLLRAVKARQPSTPVVLITGAPSVNSAIFGLRHGAYDYLPKPFSVNEVQELVDRVRRDRAMGQLPLPAGLADELARRQTGVETMFRIGELALGGIDPATLAATVLDYALDTLRGSAAVIVLREEDGTFKVTRKGDAALLSALSTMLHGAFERLVSTANRETMTLEDGRTPAFAIAAVIPGLGTSLGLLGVARDFAAGAFVPDEKELVLGYARTTAVALQKILLRENLEKTLLDTITAFVNAIESKDLYLKGHSARVALYAGEIGTVMERPPSEVTLLGRAGMLHDLGKLVMLDSILQKPTTLTPEEFALIRTHPGVGDRILEPLKFLAAEAKAVRHHHERYDGKGYPDGLAGEQIPFIARVVTVADVFDAMTSNRPYRSARPLSAARDEVLRVAGTQVDPVIAEAFAAIPAARLEEISRSYLIPPVTPDAADALETSMCAQAEAVMRS